MKLTQLLPKLVIILLVPLFLSAGRPAHHL